MKGKKLLPLITLALVSLVACNNQPAASKESSKQDPTSQQSSEPEASSSQASSESSQQSSGQGGVHTHDMETVTHAQGDGEVVMDIKKCKEDAYYEASWSATDAAATANGFTDGKFGAVGNTVEFKIWVPAAMNARLYASATYNKDNITGNTAGQEEAHSVWFDYRSSHNGFKVKVTVNNNVIDQSAQTVKVGDEDVAMKDLKFQQIAGYTGSNSETLEFPWVNIQLNEGANIINLERTHGYGHTYSKFTLKANI